MKVLNERGAVRFPKLKIVVPHCVSFLPLAVPRMQSLMPVMNNVGYLKGVDVAKNLEAFYYDLAGAATNCFSKCRTGPVQKCAEPVWGVNLNNVILS